MTNVAAVLDYFRDPTGIDFEKQSISIDDWIDIGSPGTLAALAKRYIKHLNQDSYYELF